MKHKLQMIHRTLGNFVFFWRYVTYRQSPSHTFPHIMFAICWRWNFFPSSFLFLVPATAYDQTSVLLWLIYPVFMDIFLSFTSDNFPRLTSDILFNDWRKKIWKCELLALLWWLNFYYYLHLIAFMNFSLASFILNWFEEGETNNKLPSVISQLHFKSTFFSYWQCFFWGENVAKFIVRNQKLDLTNGKKDKFISAFPPIKCRVVVPTRFWILASFSQFIFAKITLLWCFCWPIFLFHETSNRWKWIYKSFNTA